MSKRSIIATTVGSLILVSTLGLLWVSAQSHNDKTSFPGVSNASPSSTGANDFNSAPRVKNLAEYDIPSQLDRIPTARLGENLSVGDITVSVSPHGLTYLTGSLRGNGNERRAMTLFAISFMVHIKNDSGADLVLDHRKSYWVAPDSELETDFAQKNWFVVGSVSSMRRLILPDPQMMYDYRYEVLPVEVARLAKDNGLHSLPERVKSGEEGSGSIIMLHFDEGPEALSLFFGNWFDKKAWARIRLGTYSELMEFTLKSVGPNPPDPLESIIIGGDAGYGPEGIEGAGKRYH